MPKTNLLAFRIPAALIALFALLTLSAAIVSQINFRAAALDAAQDKQNVMLVQREHSVSTWLETMQKEVNVFGGLPIVTEALKYFDRFRPTGDFTTATTDIYHPELTNISRGSGFYDLFLIAPDGQIVYTVERESDYNTNLKTGPYAQSGLADAFRRAIATPGQIVFEDFEAYAPSNGAAASFAAKAVLDESGEILGVFAMQMSNDAIFDIVNDDTGLGQTGRAFLIDADSVIRSEMTGTASVGILDVLATDHWASSADRREDTRVTDMAGITGNDIIGGAMPVNSDLIAWTLVVEQDMDEVLAPILRFQMTLLGVLVASGILAAACGTIFSIRLVRALSQVNKEIADTADGDYDAVIDRPKRNDEIGQITFALDQLKENLRQGRAAEAKARDQQENTTRTVEMLREALTHLSKGDFGYMIPDDFPKEHDVIRHNYNNAIAALSKTIENVTSVAGNIRRSSSELGGASDNLSLRTENQAATLEETAAALDELTRGVKSAADDAKSADEIVGKAREDAEQSGVIVQNAITAMNDIQTSSDQISRIISVIDDISFQTNLLALNAGVEAARAGEAGRGFAVVASEVRALAQRSADAAREIKTLIDDSTSHVAEGVNLVEKTGAELTGIVEQIRRISSLMSDIANGAVEQSSGLNEINLGISQLDQVTQENAAMVEETTAATQLLLKDANVLFDQVAEFRLLGANTKAAGAETSDIHPVVTHPVHPKGAAKDAPRAKPVTNGHDHDDIGIWKEF